MILKISENLIINIEQISHIYGNELFLNDGAKFKLDEISMRNVNKIAKLNEDNLFKDNEDDHRPN